ncbi:MAG: alpha-N-acetylglucosaminidase C-terminal domain-containing protein, partial [Luteolibacter sp.]
AVQAEMQPAIPGSIWVIQSWGGTPNSSLVAGTSIEHTLIQQLISDLSTGEGEGGGFRTYQGRPWTWNEISNFGGNNGLYGNLRVIANLPNQLLGRSDLGRFSGLGTFMEAIELNPIYFDLLTDMVWRTESPDLNSWLNAAIRRRYGASNSSAELAWALLRDSVYDLPVFQFGVTDFVMAARPGPNVSKARLWGDNRQYWNPYDVYRAAELMMEAAPELGNQESFRSDLIDIIRQAVNDHTFAVYREMMQAYNAGNNNRFEQEAARLLTAMEQLDALLASHPLWMIGPWIADARAKSSDPQIQDLMETNARQLVTTWTQQNNPDLNDYASRSRSGLMRDYYKNRWQIYINDLRGGSTNYSGAGFEQSWRSDRSVTYPTQPTADTIQVANQLWSAIGADMAATSADAGRWAWTLSQGGATETLTWDVTELITRPTRLAVGFDYRAGAHAMQIDQLELLRNGEPIAIDTHNGRTGSFDTDHFYSLTFDSSHTAGDTYTLRATVSGDGGGDSTGVLQITVPGPVNNADVVGRYRRNSVVIGQHETIDLNADFTVVHYRDGLPTTDYLGHTWQQSNGLIAISDPDGVVVSYHTLTSTDDLSSDDGLMPRLALTTSVSEWAQSRGLGAPNDTIEADPDGDGLDNFIEMALGTDPTTATPQAWSADFQSDLGNGNFRFQRPKNHQTVGFLYTLEESSNLENGSWKPVPSAVIQAQADPLDPSLEQAIIQMADPAPAPRFYRLKVSAR